MNAHTPAPWVAVNHSWAVTGIYSTAGASIAQLSIADEATEETQELLEAQQEANARLISMSPELLAALQECITDLENSGYAFDHPFLVRMRALAERAK